MWLVFRSLGAMVKEGTQEQELACSCQGPLPIAQPISGWSSRQEWPQWPNLGWIIPTLNTIQSSPLPHIAQDCFRLQGRLGESGQERNGAKREGKNQKCKIKQASVGVPRERWPLSEVRGRQTALEERFQDVHLSRDCPCHYKEGNYCHTEPSATMKANSPQPN